MTAKNDLFEENDFNFIQDIKQFGDFSEPIICLEDINEPELNDLKHNFS